MVEWLEGSVGKCLNGRMAEDINRWVFEWAIGGMVGQPNEEVHVSLCQVEERKSNVQIRYVT